jgi:hypothetical protein
MGNIRRHLNSRLVSIGVVALLAVFGTTVTGKPPKTLVVDPSSRLDKLSINIDRPTLTPEDEKKLLDATARAADDK